LTLPERDDNALAPTPALKACNVPLDVLAFVTPAAESQTNHQIKNINHKSNKKIIYLQKDRLELPMERLEHLQNDQQLHNETTTTNAC
jgi:hypothetical protein